MIEFQGMSKHFGTADVLDDVSFRINPGEHVGITGPNGAGKSTIFKLLVGELSPDAGHINQPRNQRIGYLHQELQAHRIDATLIAYTENASGPIRALENELHRTEHALTNATGDQTHVLLRRLGELQTKFEHQGGYELRTRAEAALSGLGFADTDFDRPFRGFSGGWQMRAELARVLISEPDVLLLDEPTNYLDVPAVEWLRSFLEDWPGTLLLISHDRYLLNTLTRTTLEVAGGAATRYPGNYNAYVQARRMHSEQLASAKRNQDRKREQIERFVERFRSKNTKASQVQSRLKMLDKMDDIRVPAGYERPATIRLPKPARAGQEVARLDQAGISYDGTNWVFRNVDLKIERGEKAVVVGPNGAGKTTLLRALAGKRDLTEGRRALGANVVVGYQAQEYTDAMNPTATLFATARAAAADASDGDVRNLLGGFGFTGDSIDKTVEVLSGGEKVRLALACVLLRGPNFLVLDEPTTHLDIPSRQALEDALKDYKGTLCLVSHDIEFIRAVATTVRDLRDNRVIRYFGGYDYYREKRAQEQAGKSTPGNEAVQTAKGNDRRQEKRQEAQRRQEFSNRRRPLVQQAQHAERMVDRLEQERRDLVQHMENAAPETDFDRIGQRLAEIQSEIQAATQQWEEAELAIEHLREQLGLEDGRT